MGRWGGLSITVGVIRGERRDKDQYVESRVWRKSEG